MPRPSRDLAEWYCPRYHHGVASVGKIVPGMRDNPKNVRYEDLNKVCEYYFGPRAPPADPMPSSRRLGPATLA